MRGVELRHLVALDAIATHGGFGAAALALGYTQSAVSQQISTLEKRLGERLVNRGGGAHAISFTPAGTLLCHHAREIVRAMAAVEADLGALDGRRLLRVGVFQSVGSVIVPLVLSELGERRDAFEMSFHNQETIDSLEASLAEGEIDVAFTHVPRPDDDLATAWVLDDPWYLVVPAGDPLAAREAVGVRDLPAERLLTYERCRALDMMLAELDAAGVEPRFVALTDENGMLQGMAATGMGYALMSHLCIDHRDPRTRPVPVTGLSPRRIAVCWHPRRAVPHALTEFVEATVAVCARLQPTITPDHAPT